MYTQQQNSICVMDWFATGCLDEQRCFDIQDAVRHIAAEEAVRFNALHTPHITDLKDLAKTPTTYQEQLATRLSHQYGIEVSAAEVRDLHTLDELGAEIYEELEEARFDRALAGH